MNQIISIPIRDDRHEVAARARAYAIFASLFRYPTDELAATILDGSLFEELQDVVAALPHATSLDRPVLPASIDELQASYCRLFEASRPTGAEISLNEKDYVADERSEVWEDVLRFYEHFGLEYSVEDGVELPDHLVTELEFLHYLAFLEAGAEGDTGDFARARADFLMRHPGKWVRALADRFARIGADTPYAGFVGMLGEFISDEQK